MCTYDRFAPGLLIQRYVSTWEEKSPTPATTRNPKPKGVPVDLTPVSLSRTHRSDTGRTAASRTHVARSGRWVKSRVTRPETGGDCVAGRKRVRARGLRAWVVRARAAGKEQAKGAAARVRGRVTADSQRRVLAR